MLLQMGLDLPDIASQVSASCGESRDPSAWHYLLGLEAEMGHELLAWNYGIPNVVIAFVLNTSPSLFLVSSLLFEYWDFF